MVAARSSSPMPYRKIKREIQSKTTKEVTIMENELKILMVRCEELDVTCGTWPMRGQIRDRTDRATQPSEDVMCTVDCGSEVHAIPLDVARRWCPEFSRSASTMRGADAHRLRSYGRVVLILELNGRRFSV